MGLMDIFEDQDTERLQGDDLLLKIKLQFEEIKNLMPAEYKCNILPASFPYSDAERIRNVFIDFADQFLSQNSAKIMYCVACKIYSYFNEVIHTRILIVKFFPIPAHDREDGEGESDLDQIDEADEDDESTVNSGKSVGDSFDSGQDPQFEEDEEEKRNL